MKVIITILALATTTMQSHSKPWILDFLDRGNIALNVGGYSQPNNVVYYQPIQPAPMPIYAGSVPVISRGGDVYIIQPRYQATPVYPNYNFQFQSQQFNGQRYRCR